MKCYVSALAALAVALPAFAAASRPKPKCSPGHKAAPALDPPRKRAARPLARRDTQVTPACCGSGDGYPGPGGGPDSCCDGGLLRRRMLPDQCCDCDCGYGCNSCGPCSNSSGWGNWCNSVRRPWRSAALVLHGRLPLRPRQRQRRPRLLSPQRFGRCYEHHRHLPRTRLPVSVVLSLRRRLSSCLAAAKQIRFLFTRMTSSADTNLTDTDSTIVGPFETSPGPGGTFTAHGQVDTKIVTTSNSPKRFHSAAAAPAAATVLLPPELPGLGHHLGRRLPLRPGRIGIGSTPSNNPDLEEIAHRQRSTMIVPRRRPAVRRRRPALLRPAAVVQRLPERRHLAAARPRPRHRSSRDLRSRQSA